ncbi:MAG: hypothetical protein HOY69_00220 [Streptomyces sp.]|nr:hypothetical protein [Streptomyces sp.]
MKPGTSASVISAWASWAFVSGGRAAHAACTPPPAEPAAEPHAVVTAAAADTIAASAFRRALRRHG